MTDLLTQIIFYAFAGLAILSALMVITQNNPVRCVLFLVVTFFASAVLWLLAEAEFLALILVLVYVGAVMTLFLFVVMMLNVDVESVKTHFLKYFPFALILVALLIGLLLVAIPEGSFKSGVERSSIAGIYPNTDGEHIAPSLVKFPSNTDKIGLALYTDYVLPFEIAAVLLLVAIISAVALAHRGVVRSKRQNILQQIMTRPEDRIELLKMKSEK